MNQFQPRDKERKSNPGLKKEVLGCRCLTDWAGEESPFVHFGSRIGTCAFTRKRAVPPVCINLQVNVEQMPTVLCPRSSAARSVSGAMQIPQMVCGFMVGSSC